jgi:hypothetical protein
MERKSVSTWQAQTDLRWQRLQVDSGAHRERLRRSSTTIDVQRKSVRSSMSSQPSSQRATTRASKKIGISEDLAVGVDGDGGGTGSAAAATAVGLGFDVGTSGVAGGDDGQHILKSQSAAEQVS